MSDLLSSAGSAAGKIGRYFTVVSALPSVVFVCYLFLLVKTGALSGRPSWSGVVDLAPSDLLTVSLVSFVVALASHPLQFGLVQFFEGYWGTSAPARWFALVRMNHHRRRFLQMDTRLATGLNAIRAADLGPSLAVATPTTIADLIESDEFSRAVNAYPDDLRWFLPTRLGNVLRRYETAVGVPYGIGILEAAPRLAMVGQPREVSYVEDQRVQLDLAVRTSFLGAVATLLTVFFMWRHGPWLLLGLVPYLLSYVAYRGSIVIAHEYGTSLAVLVDLNRFELYDRLRIRQPDSTDDEIANNEQLMKAFRLHANVDITYAPWKGTVPETPANAAEEPTTD
ncbi:hypothetical protein BJ973_002034 [Actinoplanes tereljensis]|uniref:Uncharacterized protein n=1 Tax=Paractinoplanes tereljensis TaxID=571912 RepID=A0A919TT62_9ACTN|nr:hypothetical protein [Actinoplanes tereljensis]GIF20060.1 hypothetical protein Ate02nite_27900 [Actinoplanes tereljensis]